MRILVTHPHLSQTINESMIICLKNRSRNPGRRNHCQTFLCQTLSLSLPLSLSPHPSPHKLDRKHCFFEPQVPTPLHSNAQHTRSHTRMSNRHYRLDSLQRVASIGDSGYKCQTASLNVFVCLCVFECICVCALVPPLAANSLSQRVREGDRDREEEGLFPSVGYGGPVEGQPSSLIHIHSFSLVPFSCHLSGNNTPNNNRPPTPTPSISLCPARGSPFQPRLPFVPARSSPPLVLLSKQQTAGCVWDPAEQTHTGSEQDERGRRTHLTPPLRTFSILSPRFLLQEEFLVLGSFCGGHVYLVVFWCKCLVLHVRL